MDTYASQFSLISQWTPLLHLYQISHSSLGPQRQLRDKIRQDKIHIFTPRGICFAISSNDYKATHIIIIQAYAGRWCYLSYGVVAIGCKPYVIHITTYVMGLRIQTGMYQHVTLGEMMTGSNQKQYYCIDPPHTYVKSRYVLCKTAPVLQYTSYNITFIIVTKFEPIRAIDNLHEYTYNLVNQRSSD